MRKVTVEVKMKLLIHADEGKDISDVIGEMEHNFIFSGPGADIIDTEILDYEVTDSR